MRHQNENPKPHRFVNGGESAADELNRAFRHRLCSLVDREMGRRYRRREDPEDVVQSVFRTFFRRNDQGEFQFEHTGALWKLLQKIARRKMLKHSEFHQAKARDVEREEYVEADKLPQRSATTVEARLLGDALEAVLAGLEPLEPEIFRLSLHGYTIGEIVDLVLGDLDSPYPEILQFRLQGDTESQIAAKLECGREAVRYKLKRIRERLSKILGEHSGG